MGGVGFGVLHGGLPFEMGQIDSEGTAATIRGLHQPGPDLQALHAPRTFPRESSPGLDYPTAKGGSASDLRNVLVGLFNLLGPTHNLRLKAKDCFTAFLSSRGLYIEQVKYLK